MICRAGFVPPGTSTAQQDDGDDRGERGAVDHEREQRAALEVAHEEPDREPAAEEGGEDRGEKRAAFSGGDAGAYEVEQLVSAGGGGNGDAEQEREARGRRAVQAGDEAGRDRDPRPRRSRNEGEDLRATDRQALSPGDPTQRVVT